MRRLTFLTMILAAAMAVLAIAEDRSVLIVTPRGVWKIDVIDGVPQEKHVPPYDVIIQGFGTPNPTPPVDDPPVDDPPVTDPVVAQIITISRATLQDEKEATAVASIIDTLTKFGLSGQKFKEALQLAGPIADTSMKAEGRINRWISQALAVSADAAKLKAGVKAAFDIDTATLNMIFAAANAGPGAALPAEALDWGQVIQIIQLIIELLRNLGIIS